MQAGFGFALLGLGVIGVVAYLMTGRLREEVAHVQHSVAVIAELRLLNATIADAEAAQRGHTITGDERYLTTYEADCAAIDAQLSNVRTLTADNADQQRRLEALATLVSRRLAFSPQIPEVRRAHGFDAAQASAVSGPTKIFQNKVGRLLAGMEKFERDLLLQKEHAAQGASALTRAAIVSGGTLAIGVVGIAAIIFRRDITGGRRARGALAGANARLQSRVAETESQIARLTDLVPGAIYTLRIGADGRTAMTFVSHGWEKLTGLSATSVRDDAASALSLLHPEDVAGYRDALADATRRRGAFHAEFRFKHARRGFIWLEAQSTPEFLPDGTTLWHGYTADVTARKLTEQALRESREHLSIFIEHAPAALAMFDRDMHYLYASRRWHSDYRLGAGSLNGRSHYEVFPEISEAWKAVHRCALAGETVRSDADRFERADGSVQWLRWEVRPWFAETAVIGGVVVMSEDITSRVEAEQAAREADALYRSLVSLSPDAVFVNQDNRVVYMNRCGLELWRAGSESEILGLKPLELIHPDFRDQVAARIARLWQSGGAAPQIELQILTRDGRTVDVETAAAVFEFKGRPAIQVVMRDISERKRSELALRASEAKFAQAFADNPAAISISHLSDGRILAVNNTWEKMMGYSRAEMIGRSARHTWVDQEAAPRFVREMRERGAVQGWELEFRRKSGEHYFAELWSTFLDLAGEKVLLTTLVDITGRKRAEEALRTHQVILEETGRIAKVGGWSFDAATGRGFWTDEVARIHDLDPKLPITREIGLNYYAEQSRPVIAAAVNTALEKGTSYDLELEVVSAKGVRKWVRTIGHAVRENGRVVGLRGSFQDISERRRIEDEIRQLNIELEKRVAERTVELAAANKELEAFSYSVSHDLRAPLRAVDGFAQALQEEFGEQAPPEARRYLEIIRTGAQQMGALIDDLLTFSRMSRLPVTRRPIDTAEFVRDALAELGAPWPHREVNLRLGDLPPCEADSALLKRAWINLLSNALKYTQRRQPAEIEIGSLRERGETVFFVRDNGAGFDMRYAQKLFGVFQRLHPAEKYEGTGVGLAIVQRVVQRHGGRIWATAEVERGATFFFTLSEPLPP